MAAQGIHVPPLVATLAKQRRERIERRRNQRAVGNGPNGA
jgi:hypothetical protein